MLHVLDERVDPLLTMIRLFELYASRFLLNTDVVFTCVLGIDKKKYNQYYAK